MSGPDPRASASLPILLCGILGGMVGGLSCCCYIVPVGTSFWAVRWARNLRGPQAQGLFGVGMATTAITSVLMATFGTAVNLYLNDPGRMSAEQQAMLEQFLGGAGMSDMPMGVMAMMFAGLGGIAGLAGGLLGTALGAAGQKRRSSVPPVTAPPKPVMPAPVAPSAPAAPAAPAPPAHTDGAQDGEPSLVSSGDEIGEWKLD